MKRFFCGISLLVLTVGSAQAALLGRDLNGSPGSFEAYYDDVLNITWLADANYAQTAGYDADGLMTWSDAQAWIASLNTANHLGVNNWRLPTIMDTGSSGCDDAYSGTDCGYNVQTMSGSTVYSEMAHLYYSTLGNSALYDTNGVLQPCGFDAPNYCLTNTVPFSNLQPNYYWSGTTYAPTASYAWYFYFINGSQAYAPKTYNDTYAWPVASGDVAAVPAPGALWLFVTGAAALGLRLKRRVLDPAT